MSDISIDRNKKLDLIAGLAATANGRSSMEQEVLASTIALLCAGIGNELASLRETRQAEHERNMQAAVDTAARAFKTGAASISASRMKRAAAARKHKARRVIKAKRR